MKTTDERFADIEKERGFRPLIPGSTEDRPQLAHPPHKVEDPDEDD